MNSHYPIHPDFQRHLDFRPQEVLHLFPLLRNFILDLAGPCYELLYNTHALTPVFTPTKKMGDGFIHIPIYTAHLNLGFNKGTLLEDPDKKLQGTGKLIRHIPIEQKSDFDNQPVKDLVLAAVELSKSNASEPFAQEWTVISKIKN